MYFLATQIISTFAADLIRIGQKKQQHSVVRLTEKPVYIN